MRRKVIRLPMAALSVSFETSFAIVCRTTGRDKRRMLKAPADANFHLGEADGKADKSIAFGALELKTRFFFFKHEVCDICERPIYLCEREDDPDYFSRGLVNE